MRHLRYLDSRIQFVVLTESGPNTNFPALKGYGVEVVQVPRSFRPQKAMYKARALEYFRRVKAFGDDDWGIIAYNTVNYWRNYLLTFSEIVRFRDDIGKFQFAHNMLHFPLNGYHGSFLLVRGEVENAVTWETDCLAEDLWFAQQAWNKGFYGGFIPSIAREQSNYSLSDLHRQRRRWFCGMWTLGWIGRMNVLLWTLSNIELLIGFFAFSGHLHLPLWLSIWVRPIIHPYTSGSRRTHSAVQDASSSLDDAVPQPRRLATADLMCNIQCGQAGTQFPYCG
ncbi:MAG: hypothetical protein M1836_003894 [Candelina mexicana]|nr:MAG: hypothetical protein M1836_003894 [Candelina mexicana]